ncbi:RHS repeat-associated core domain-containing protein [Patescibacteria group bacterium]
MKKLISLILIFNISAFLVVKPIFAYANDNGMTSKPHSNPPLPPIRRAGKGEGTGATTTKHIFLGGQIIATVEGNGTATSTYYIHTDHLGGSSIISDSSGDLEQLIDYYPFGDMRLNEKEGSFDEQRKFTGHEHDDDTDLEYMMARYYSGDSGRFLSVDVAIKSPNKDLLTKPQELNSYSYVANNPLKYIDPTGESVELVVRTVNMSFRGQQLNIPALHAFVRVKPVNIGTTIDVKSADNSNKSVITLGSGGNDGSLRTIFGGHLYKSANSSSDTNLSGYAFVSSMEMQNPDGMNQTDFENAVIAAYNNSPDQIGEYSPASLSDQVNCHNFASQILMDAGVSSEQISSINTGKNLAPGLGEGTNSKSWGQRVTDYSKSTWNSAKSSISNFGNKVKNLFNKK